MREPSRSPWRRSGRAPRWHRRAARAAAAARRSCRRAARRGASARSRPCWASWMPTTVSVGSPKPRSRAAIASTIAVGLRIGQAARRPRSVKSDAVGRVDQRDARPAAARRARRNRSSSVVSAVASAAVALCCRLRITFCVSWRQRCVRATRFPADSRTARSPPGARSGSSARPIGPGRWNSGTT